jgi:pantoate--beta-alanine ligase
MQSFSRRLKSQKRSIGFVPTMGALHEGHLSLVRNSRDDNDVTVVSIFVNPTQFGPDEDLQKYPRDPEVDVEKLLSIGVDAVFMPDAEEMYPEGFTTVIDVGEIGKILCGQSRPGHFNGVATVVAKLFNIVMPHRAYFGQKDYQQSVIIKKLVRELNFDIEIIICPIVREPDGLAMSSRNAYLSEDERTAATVLYKMLKRGEELIKQHGVSDSVAVGKEMMKILDSERSVSPDFIEIVDPETLENVSTIESPVVLCIAVRVGATRLIDNMVVGEG